VVVKLAGAPDQAALIVDGQACTYAALESAADEEGTGLEPGALVVLIEEAAVRPVAILLGALRAGAVAVLINPRLTPRERAELEDALEPPPAGTAVVLFTAGTTGRPKPVPLHSDQLAGRVAFFTNTPRPPEVRLQSVPLFHIGGLLGLLVNLGGGHTTVVQRRFDAGEWLDLVERHRVQSTFVVPTMLHRILEHPRFGAADLSSLSSLSYGAAPMPPDLIDRALEALPHVGFVNTFGQTETIGGITMLGPDDHRDPVHRRSVGRPLPGIELRIVPDGDEGELWARHAGAQEWQHTGDIVRRDADGYLYALGRLSDTINRGGEKFGPGEVEGVLRSHPAVADVAVAGVPDPEMGLRVGAVVVAKAPVDLDDLRAWCDGRVAPFKRPERLVVVDRLPLNDVGKVDRRALLAVLAAG
jgi:long-chain acyl-CoA synthetase